MNQIIETICDFCLDNGFDQREYWCGLQADYPSDTIEQKESAMHLIILLDCIGHFWGSKDIIFDICLLNGMDISDAADDYQVELIGYSLLKCLSYGDNSEYYDSFSRIRYELEKNR